MSEVNVIRFSSHLCGWGEGLCWDDRSQILYFVDCAENKIGVVSLETPDTLQFVSTPSMPTKVLLSNKNSGAMVLLEDGLYNFSGSECESVPVIEMPAQSAARFNDATADGQGRLITGNLNLEAEKTGSYWRWDKAKGWAELVDEKANANGPCFSQDGRQLFFADTPSGNIYKYDYDAETGNVTGQQVFANTFAQGGAPDGAAFDREGYLWTALYGGGAIARYTPLGNLDRLVEVPVLNPTDIVFAGPDLDRMIVTSALEYGGEGAVKSPLAGACFEICGTGAVGVPIGALVL